VEELFKLPALDPLALELGRQPAQPSQASTTLVRPVWPGETRLDVASQESFAVGDVISITGGGSSETRTIAGFGSVVVCRPLTCGYPAGAVVSKQVAVPRLKLGQVTDATPAPTDGHSPIQMARRPKVLRAPFSVLSPRDVQGNASENREDSFGSVVTSVATYRSSRSGMNRMPRSAAGARPTSFALSSLRDAELVPRVDCVVAPGDQDYSSEISSVPGRWLNAGQLDKRDACLALPPPLPQDVPPTRRPDQMDLLIFGEGRR
jgi:hypothetical protein